jgi:hypothetical protein
MVEQVFYLETRRGGDLEKQGTCEEGGVNFEIHRVGKSRSEYFSSLTLMVPNVQTEGNFPWERDTVDDVL